MRAPRGVVVELGADLASRPHLPLHGHPTCNGVASSAPVVELEEVDGLTGELFGAGAVRGPSFLGS